MTTHLQGNGQWPWLHAEVENADIVVRGATATWFGGDSDPMDNGETASGVSTKDNPGIMGVALPMNGFGGATAGSPIPHLPWHTHVRVYCPATGKQMEAGLIDIGPAKWTQHGIDLTVALFRALGGDVKDGTMTVDYRVIDGAKHVS